MASHSKDGSVPRTEQIADADHAIAVLSLVHHWRATKTNRSGRGTGCEVTITSAGHRVMASRKTFVEAVQAGLDKLRSAADGKASSKRRRGDPKPLRLVRED